LGGIRKRGLQKNKGASEIFQLQKTHFRTKQAIFFPKSKSLNGHTSIKGKTIALKTGGNIPKFQINPSGSVISTFIIKVSKIYQNAFRYFPDICSHREAVSELKNISNCAPRSVLHRHYQDVFFFALKL